MRRLLRSRAGVALAAAGGGRRAPCRRARRPTCRSGRPAGCGATRCRRATRCARWRSPGSTGYAVGDFGTLLKTGDGGATWSGLPAGTFSNLTELQVLDGNTLFAGGGCVARRSTDGGKTFTRIAFTQRRVQLPGRGSNLAALAFLDANTGYIVRAAAARSSRPTTAGRASRRRSRCRGRARSGGGAVPTDARVPSPTTGLRRDERRQHLPDDRRRQLVEVGRPRPTARCARSRSSRDRIAYAVGDGSLFLKSDRRRRDVGRQGRRRRAGRRGPDRRPVRR